MASSRTTPVPMEFMRQYLGHHSPETFYQYVTHLPGSETKRGRTSRGN